MDHKIKFMLVKFEKAVVFQVLEMDKRFKGGNFFESELNVYSQKDPMLAIGGVYLQGDFVSRDLNISILYFKTNKERDKYYKDVLYSLEDWAENWPGWEESKKKKENKEGIFCF